MSGESAVDHARLNRERVGAWSLRVAVALTGLWGLLVLLRVVGGVSLRSGVADAFQFVLVVAYVVGVPIASGLAARLGNRPIGRVRIAVALLIGWLAFLIWTATLSL
jgi:hypothetical protein